MQWHGIILIGFRGKQAASIWERKFISGGRGREEDKGMDTILKTLIEIKSIEEKFVEIQENPAIYDAENGLIAYESAIFEKLNKKSPLQSSGVF
jgi:hypothetical protein